MHRLRRPRRRWQQRTFDRLVIARLAEFFDHRTPWNRSLWQIGAILGLQEVGEYGEVVEDGQPNDGLVYVCESMRRVCGDDPGLGTKSVSNEICDHLQGDKPKLPLTRASLRQLTRRCTRDYLVRWADAVSADSSDRPSFGCVDMSPSAVSNIPQRFGVYHS